MQSVFAYLLVKYICMWSDIIVWQRGANHSYNKVQLNIHTMLLFAQTSTTQSIHGQCRHAFWVKWTTDWGSLMWYNLLSGFMVGSWYMEYLFEQIVFSLKETWTGTLLPTITKLQSKMFVINSSQAGLFGCNIPFNNYMDCNVSCG